MVFPILILAVTAAIAGAGYFALRIGVRPGRLMAGAVILALMAAVGGMAWGNVYFGHFTAAGWILGLMAGMVIVLTMGAMVSIYQYMQHIQIIRRMEDQPPQ